MQAHVPRWTVRGYMLIVGYAAVALRLAQLLLTWKGGFH